MDSEPDTPPAQQAAPPDDTPAHGARVTTRSISLPPGTSEVVDVLLDGRRVFSLAPSRLEAGRRGRLRTQWPAALRPYLRGSTTVTLRTHVAGEVLVEEELTFGEAPGRVAVVDGQGVPLILDKWGALQRPFEADAPDKAQLLADTEELLRVLNDEVGVPAFIAYGTLLGAVRQGGFLGHDNDVDVAYYSRFEHPADIMRESFVVQRRLRELGWGSRRRTGAFLQVHKDDGGPPRKIDLFTAYHCQGAFAVHKWVRGHLPREAVLPLGEATLEGTRLPAPHDPEALLALTYGEDWRVPDPAFAFDYPPSVRLRAESWFGGRRRDKGKWRKATRSALGSERRREPSAFAQYVDDQLSTEATVVDLGCGIGDDAAWFARDGRPVIGIDYLGNALARAQEAAAEAGVAPRFEQVDLYDLRSAMVSAARIALSEAEPVVYVRHLLEALHREGEANLWLFAKTVLGGGGRLFLEFHTRDGADGSPQRLPSAFRRGRDPEQVTAEVAARGGTVLSQEMSEEAGRQVCRLLASFGG